MNNLPDGAIEAATNAGRAAFAAWRDRPNRDAYVYHAVAGAAANAVQRAASHVAAHALRIAADRLHGELTDVTAVELLRGYAAELTAQKETR